MTFAMTRFISNTNINAREPSTESTASADSRRLRNAAPRVLRETRVGAWPEVTRAFEIVLGLEKRCVQAAFSLHLLRPPIVERWQCYFDLLAKFCAGVDRTSMLFSESFLDLFFFPQSVCETAESMHGTFVLKARLPLST